MTRAPQTVLPCTCGYTLIRSGCGVRRCDDRLVAGTWGKYTYQTVLDFDATGMLAGAPVTALLCITVQRMLPCCRLATLCIEGPGNVMKEAQINRSGPQCIDISALLCQPLYGKLRFVITTAYCYSPLIFFEPVSPALCIAITHDARCGCMNAEERTYRFDFDQTDSTPDIDTALSYQSTFFVTNGGDNSIEVCTEVSAEAIHWVQGTRLPVEMDETRALVCKYYGKYTRLRLYASGHGKAEVRFVGQQFG